MCQKLRKAANGSWKELCSPLKRNRYCWLICHRHRWILSCVQFAQFFSTKLCLLQHVEALDTSIDDVHSTASPDSQYSPTEQQLQLVQAVVAYLIPLASSVADPLRTACTQLHTLAAAECISEVQRDMVRTGVRCSTCNKTLCIQAYIEQVRHIVYFAMLIGKPAYPVWTC